MERRKAQTECSGCCSKEFIDRVDISVTVYLPERLHVFLLWCRQTCRKCVWGALQRGQHLLRARQFTSGPNRPPGHQGHPAGLQRGGGSVQATPSVWLIPADVVMTATSPRLWFTVSLQDINLRKAFKSSTIQDQKVLSKDSTPDAVAELHCSSDKPPPLDALTAYR